MHSATDNPSVSGAPSDMNNSLLGKRPRGSKEAADTIMAGHRDLACANLWLMSNESPFYYTLPSDIKKSNPKMYAVVGSSTGAFWKVRQLVSHYSLWSADNQLLARCLLAHVRCLSTLIHSM